MEVSGQLHATVVLTPGESASRTYRIGGWVAPESVWTRCRREKVSSLPLPGIEPRSFSSYWLS